MSAQFIYLLSFPRSGRADLKVRRELSLGRLGRSQNWELLPGGSYSRRKLILRTSIDQKEAPQTLPKKPFFAKSSLKTDLRLQRKNYDFQFIIRNLARKNKLFVFLSKLAKNDGAKRSWKREAKLRVKKINFRDFDAKRSFAKKSKIKIFWREASLRAFSFDSLSQY